MHAYRGTPTENKFPTTVTEFLLLSLYIINSRNSASVSYMYLSLTTTTMSDCGGGDGGGGDGGGGDWGGGWGWSGSGDDGGGNDGPSAVENFADNIFGFFLPVMAA